MTSSPKTSATRPHSTSCAPSSGRASRRPATSARPSRPASASWPSWSPRTISPYPKRSLSIKWTCAQSVDPRAVNVDWVALRRRQRDPAVEDVKAELILDRIATAENIDVDEKELERELVALAERSGESATAIRARLTKQGALDRMKSKLQSEKTLEWLYRNTRIQTTAEAKR